jgi:DNA-binding NtrC family response regulator
VRVIAACNSDLEAAVRAGRFRQDLFYRLNVIPFTLLPLRERRGDIRLLARHFLRKHAADAGRPKHELAEAAFRKLMFYDWPGNVRQLENVIERAVVLSEAPCIRAEDIHFSTQTRFEEVESFRTSKARVVEQFEKDYLQQVLASCGGNITQAARAAKKNRRAFWELMRKHQIEASPCEH